MAGFDEHRLHAFGERATALVVFGAMPRPEGLPHGWVPAAPPDPSWAGEDCSVCMHEFSSPWPERGMRTRVRRRAAGTARTQSAATAMPRCNMLRTPSAPCAGRTGVFICILEDWGQPGNG